MNLSSFFQSFLFCTLISASINLSAMIGSNIPNTNDLILARYSTLKTNKPSMNRSNAASYGTLITYIESCNNLVHDAQIAGNQKIASESHKMAGQARNFVERFIDN